MANKSTPSLEELQTEHRELYKQFLPTLTQYQDMAKRALELQIAIFDKRLRQAFPTAPFSEQGLILKISAREKPSRLEELLTELAKTEIKVSSIIYDPRTFEFYLYGNKE